MKLVLRLGSLAGLILPLLLAGCGTKYYRHSADKQAYGLIKAKSATVPNMDSKFTIEQTNVVRLESFPVSTNVQEFLGPDGERERGARRLNLEDALWVGIHSSRAYQNRKEQLYISGLTLSLARHQLTPLFSASGSAKYIVDTEKGETVVIDEVTGEQKIVVSDQLVEQHRVTAGGDINGSWLIRDVGRITAAFSADVTRLVSGGGGGSGSSQLGATFTRPLLRNAAFKSQVEALIQAERQLVYDIRDFTRYRKDFSVQIATAYYNVLGNRDAVRNSFLNLQSSRKNAERSRALAEEGRITQSDLGRLEQQVLSAESSWNNTIRSYKQSLDNFKLQLGLNVDASLVLDDAELETLRIQHPNLPVEQSIEVALTARLDYLNAKDEFADSVRKVDVAASALKPQVDLAAAVNINSDPNSKVFLPLPEPSRYSWNAGLSPIDLGLDRVAERNSYVTSVISRNRAARAVVEQEDQIKLQVRDSWRTLDQARRNYDISEIGVKLAERRVEEQNLLAELGRAKAQDQVDAENSLIDSRNQRTQALVTHTVARLQFWNNLGILYIKDNGGWEEVKDAKAP